MIIDSKASFPAWGAPEDAAQDGRPSGSTAHSFAAPAGPPPGGPNSDAHPYNDPEGPPPSYDTVADPSPFPSPAPRGSGEPRSTPNEKREVVLEPPPSGSYAPYSAPQGPPNASYGPYSAPPGPPNAAHNSSYPVGPSAPRALAPSPHAYMFAPQERMPLNPLPLSFTRAPPSHYSYAPFPPLVVEARGAHLEDGFFLAPPPTALQPHPFVLHDITEDDWVRCVRSTRYDRVRLSPVSVISFLEDIQITGRRNSVTSGSACSNPNPFAKARSIPSLIEATGAFLGALLRTLHS